MPVLRLRMAAPSTLVDIGSIEEMKGIRDAGDHLVVGANATHYEVMNSPVVKQHAPLLAQARHRRRPGDSSSRHLRWSLAHADPAGDLPTVALALDATMVAKGPKARVRSRRRTSSSTTSPVPSSRRRSSSRSRCQARRRLEHALREVQPHRAGLGDRRRRGSGQATKRTIAEARVALTNMGPSPCAPAASRPPWPVPPHPPTRSRRPRQTPPTALGRRATCTPRRSSASIWPRCSPSAPWRRPPASNARHATVGRSFGTGPQFVPGRACRNTVAFDPTSGAHAGCRRILGVRGDLAG